MREIELATTWPPNGELYKRDDGRTAQDPVPSEILDNEPVSSDGNTPKTTLSEEAIKYYLDRASSEYGLHLASN